MAAALYNNPWCSGIKCSEEVDIVEGCHTEEIILLTRYETVRISLVIIETVRFSLEIPAISKAHE